MITTQAGAGPADFADVRATNLSVVLRFVRANTPCSRADIAASTGLNKATVSSLVGELIERRLLRETGLATQRIGRPATMLTIDGSGYAAVGLEINIDYLSAVAIDLAGDRLLSWRRAFAGRTSSPSNAVAALAALARRAAGKITRDGRQVLGLTVGVPGLVCADGTVRFSPNLGWRDVNLPGELRRALDRLDIPVAVDNDANLAAVAEYRYGVGAASGNLVYLAGDVGVGSGIVADGTTLRGALGYAGELGHVLVAPDGPRCGCGRRGCFEAVAGIAALIRTVSPEAASDGPIIDFAPEIDDVVRRAGRGDRVVLDALDALGRALGHGASILANLLNPEVIVLGGYFVPLASWILPQAQSELTERTVAPDAGGCRIVVSTLGHGAAAIGGAAQVIDAVDAGNLAGLPAPG